MHVATKNKPEYSNRYFKEREVYRYDAVERIFGKEAIDYISQYVDISDPGTEMLATSEPFNIEAMNGKSLQAFVNLKRVNDIDQPNEFFGLVNQKISPGGYYIGCVETVNSRRRRILNKYPRLLAYPVYSLDFIIKRVFPKLKPTRKIYSVLTRGINRAMSLTETLGRLVTCGFEVIAYNEIGYLTYFVCKKVKDPFYNGQDTYGFMISLERIGKEGKLFKVYKFRTMHPYAEYLQDYVHKKNHLNDGGKFNGDFRVTSWGRIMRKLWIDEQPMWINWLRREMKLVGVRPLSEQYFSLYPKEFQQRRIKYKPGLLPPFYVDLPVTFEEIIESERRYLDAYDKYPWFTDCRYFWKALYNILIKRARSA